MPQKYSCSNCSAPVSFGDKFCGNCGISLNWGVHQMPPPSSPLLHGYQDTNQQKTWERQRSQYERRPKWNDHSVQRRHVPDNQKSVPGNLNQCQRRYVYNNHSTLSQKNSSSVDSRVKPMSAEISKLLTDFFDKHVKYNKV